MHDWIEHGGRVAIWTRDMSWAQNQETRGLLTEKARRSELILCLPELGALATELSKAGAEVCAYGATRLESPASRFTIAFLVGMEPRRLLDEPNKIRTSSKSLAPALTQCSISPKTSLLLRGRSRGSDADDKSWTTSS